MDYAVAVQMASQVVGHVIRKPIAHSANDLAVQVCTYVHTRVFCRSCDNRAATVSQPCPSGAPQRV